MQYQGNSQIILHVYIIIFMESYLKLSGIVGYYNDSDSARLDGRI